jgi:hypothetical protein
MTARTIQTPATLRRDTRFQAATPGEKWVYGHLCDRDEVVAEPGLDVLGTVVLIVEGGFGHDLVAVAEVAVDPLLARGRRLEPCVAAQGRRGLDGARGHATLSAERQVVSPGQR